ncbi:MAG: enolase C-terminal domain-like protein, partial [Planctomycetota bacterium]
MSEAVVHRVTVWPLQIPLRWRVCHASAQRTVSDPIVVELELTNGVTGYGEAVPRSYLTGETAESVDVAISMDLVPAISTLRASTFSEALEAAERLPWLDHNEEPMPSARAAVELALLDAVMRTFRRTMNDVVQWMELTAFGTPGSMDHIRFSGLLATEDASLLMRQLRKLYWRGFKDVILKVGMPGDAERLEKVWAYLKKPLRGGRMSLRLDANGRWSAGAARKWFAQCSHMTIAAWEQPLSRGDEDDLPEFREFLKIPLIHDESLTNAEDAQRLV